MLIANIGPTAVAATVAEDRGYTLSRKPANAANAFRSAHTENRVPEWKTGGAIFMSAVS